MGRKTHKAIVIIELTMGITIAIVFPILKPSLWVLWLVVPCCVAVIIVTLLWWHWEGFIRRKESFGLAIQMLLRPMKIRIPVKRGPKTSIVKARIADPEIDKLKKRVEVLESEKKRNKKTSNKKGI